VEAAELLLHLPDVREHHRRRAPIADLAHDLDRAFVMVARFVHQTALVQAAPDVAESDAFVAPVAGALMQLERALETRERFFHAPLLRAHDAEVVEISSLDA